MFLTFRWYGRADPVGLDRIRQIPAMRGVVAALHDRAPGEAWPADEVRALRDTVVSAGLELSAVESIPVHEEIKLGGRERDRHISAWIDSLRAVGTVAVPVVVYNFMPVFDWTRSELGKVLPDGSLGLSYDQEAIDRMDPLEGDLALPGWIGKHDRAELADLLARYREIGMEELWSNLAYFIRAVAPAAEAAGIRLAIHPDDPPWPVFGLPRIITGGDSLRKLFALCDSPANGVCLCTGSFGALEGNDLAAMAREFAPRIAFAHLRNVRRTGPRSFEESAHWSGAGSLDMAGIVRALAESGYRGPVRPDHGRMIWGEEGRPGYGLFDRALGSQYIQGLIDGIGSG